MNELNTHMVQLCLQVEGEIVVASTKYVLWRNDADNGMYVVHRYTIQEGKLALAHGHYTADLADAYENYCERDM